jgi:hypothetical protein
MITKFETSGGSGSGKSSNAIIYLIGAIVIGYFGYKYVIKPEMDKRKAEQTK